MPSETTTFMMISKWKKPFGLHGLNKQIQRFKGWPNFAQVARCALHHNNKINNDMKQYFCIIPFLWLHIIEAVLVVKENVGVFNVILSITRCQTNAESMLGQPRRGWTNVET